MAAQYPPLPGPPPQVYTHDDHRRWEQELQNLAVADWILRKAERLKIPVEATRRDCDALCELFTNLLSEERGQQSANPLPLV